MDNYLKWIFKF